MALTPYIISIGPSVVMTQNAVYALPAKLTWFTSSHPVDTSIDGVAFVALANATTGAMTGSVFVRCTVANATVVAKDASAAPLA